MDTLLLVIAACGGLMIVIGRFLIIHQARQISGWWVIALRVLPLAELMFLARYWEAAKKGAFTSLVGMALVMPWGGKRLYDSQQVMSEMQMRSGAGRVLALGEKGWEGASKEEKEAWLQCKQERLVAMNARLLGWYKEIQERRAALGTDIAEVTAFNAEAAAYHEFSAVAREETTVLAKLREKQTP